MKNNDFKILQDMEIEYEDSQQGITDGRLLFGDITFYSRLLNHLEGCQANCLLGQEELEYLTRRARMLQRFQVDTACIDSDEYQYLKNLNLVV